MCCLHCSLTTDPHSGLCKQLPPVHSSTIVMSQGNLQGEHQDPSKMKISSIIHLFTWQDDDGNDSMQHLLKS